MIFPGVPPGAISPGPPALRVWAVAPRLYVQYLSNSTFGSLSSLFDNHDRENHATVGSPPLPPRLQVVKGRRTRASKELTLSIASTIYRQAAGSSTSAGIRTTFEAARAGANSSFRSASGIKPQHQARASSSSRSASTRSASRLLKTNLPFNLRPTEVNMFTLIRSYRQSQNCQPQRSEQVSARLKRFVNRSSAGW